VISFDGFLVWRISSLTDWSTVCWFLQKFDNVRNQYTFCDKYFGKEFSEAEFGQVLRSFLDNGSCFRSDLLPSILKMLKDLGTSIRSHPSFR